MSIVAIVLGAVLALAGIVCSPTPPKRRPRPTRLEKRAIGWTWRLEPWYEGTPRQVIGMMLLAAGIGLVLVGVSA